MQNWNWYDFLAGTRDICLEELGQEDYYKIQRYSR